VRVVEDASSGEAHTESAGLAPEVAGAAEEDLAEGLTTPGELPTVGEAQLIKGGNCRR
jgi:hypothetical protein